MPGLRCSTAQVKQAARSSSAIAPLRRQFNRISDRFAARGHAIGIQYRRVASEVTRRAAQGMGAEWDPKDKTWRMPRAAAIKLGLLRNRRPPGRRT
jgi:hypothetical protein